MIHFTNAHNGIRGGWYKAGEPGTQSQSPTWLAGAQLLEQSWLPPRPLVCRKMELGAEPNSDMDMGLLPADLTSRPNAHLQSLSFFFNQLEMHQAITNRKFIAMPPSKAFICLAQEDVWKQQSMATKVTPCYSQRRQFSFILASLPAILGILACAVLLTSKLQVL